MATVAVVGGGPQGLGALKNLLEEGFKATLFERKKTIGGLWAFNEDTSDTTVLPTTLGNISRFKNCYADFPVPSTTKSIFLDAAETLEYLESYAKHFKLHEHIQLETAVTSIQRDEVRECWNIHVKSPKGEDVLPFDKVVIATGQYSSPYTPQFPGTDLFKGKMIHSQAFKDPSQFRNMKVLVIGGAITASDCAVELVNSGAEKVFMSSRRGNMIFPRFVKGVPVDVMTSRKANGIMASLSELAPAMIQKVLDVGASRLADSCWPDLPSEWKTKPRVSIALNRPIVSDKLVDCMKKGEIKSVPILTRFTGSDTAELSDGSTLQIDAVIFCTGYRSETTSLCPELCESISPRKLCESTSSSSSSSETNSSEPPLLRLYQNIFPPEHASSLALLTQWKLGTGICEIADLLGMALAQIWQGHFPLPPIPEMDRTITRHHAWARAVAGAEDADSKMVAKEPWKAWLNEAAGTGCNERLGYGWGGWRFWWRERRWCGILMEGVDSPHVMRLWEGRRKGRWEGARGAIEEANREVERMKRER
ncbi:MAG: hypothetical protein Q9227_003143 [Pyrenula ochraceoflavens]